MYTYNGHFFFIRQIMFFRLLFGKIVINNEKTLPVMVKEKLSENLSYESFFFIKKRKRVHIL